MREKLAGYGRGLIMVIGITGSYGSGKTTVAGMFGRLGAYVIDADKVYHSLMMPGKSCHKKIAGYFGKAVLNKTGHIDRKKLGKIVFGEKSKLKVLNNLVHPEILKEIRRMAKSSRKEVVVIDAPLLLETCFYKEVDKVVLISNKKELQIKRIKGGRGLSCADTVKRIGMQMPFKKKLAFADFIIDNSGTKIKTLNRVKEIWENLGA
jgi:dephospho-CoA kinase